MGFLKQFLEYSKKSTDDIIMDPCHMLGIVKVDISTFAWLDKQEKITKRIGYDLMELRHTMSPWLFNQVNMIFLGYYGPCSNHEEELVCYETEDGLMLFTFDSKNGADGFYVLLAPVIDLKKDAKSIVTHDKRSDDP